MNLLAWTNSLEQISERLAAMLPEAGAVAGLILTGWIAAILLRLVTRRMIIAVVTRINTYLRPTDGLGETRLIDEAPRVMSTLVYWVVLLFFLVVVIDRLSLPVVTSVLESLAHYLPRVLLAVAIVFIGMGAGIVANRWTTRVASAAGVSYAPALGRIVQFAVLIVALVVGVQEVGLESAFFTAAILVMLAAVLGALGLAFGLGSGPIVTNIMASYYASQAYRVGDVVRVADIEGTVQEIRSTSIVLDTADGQVHLPARKYCDDISVVLRRA